MTELLVVVAILATLAAALTAVTSRLKMKAASSQCVSNLRQLAGIATMEASETGFYPPMLSQKTGNGGGLEHSGNHFGLLVVGMEAMSCPAAKYTGLDKNGNPITSYGSNPMVMIHQRDGTPDLVRPSQISRPSEVFLMADCAQHGPPNTRTLNFCARWYGKRTGDPANAAKPLSSEDIPTGGFWDPDVSTLPLRHDGHANVVFCDGHVTTISSHSELKEKNLYWNY